MKSSQPIAVTVNNSWMRTLYRPDVLVSIAVATLVIWLNYYATGMQGILKNYVDFKRIILAGFDSSVAVGDTPTFPMWGYGWLMVLTENHLALVIIQMSLALVATQLTLLHLESTQQLTRRSITILRWSIAFAIPWYAFHSLRWPYSIAVSLFLISMVCLDRSISKKLHQRSWLVASGLAFGILLNFRSDYYLMPIGLAVGIVAIRMDRLRALRDSFIWLTAIYAMLVPWSLYTWKVTGHPLITSTNSGHVCFIGLGNLPGNKWGITEYDEDPTMRRLITKEFCGARSSLTYETDRFLLGEFKRMVGSDPREYARKCVWSARRMILEGAYPGEFYRDGNSLAGGGSVDDNEAIRSRGKSLLISPLQFVRTEGWMTTTRYGLAMVSKALGIGITLLGFAALPLVLVNGWLNRRPLQLLFGLAVAYQCALQIFAYTMRSYTSNMLLVHLINVAFSVALIRMWFSRRSPATISASTACPRDWNNSVHQRAA